MSYLKIENIGTMNRKYIELVGLSSKRNAGPDTIGHKGSGTKLSAVAALRLGLDLHIASSDHAGEYLLSFKTKKVDIGEGKVNQIFFVYNPTPSQKEIKEYSRDMVGEAFMDWDKTIGNDDKKSFKVFREYICNAIDADPNFKMEIVNKPHPAEKGKTAVFIRYTKEIQDMFKEMEKYFKFLSKAQALVSIPAIGDLFPKTEKDHTRLFVQGVLVDCTDDYSQSSLFDYSMRLKTLVSEERIIKDLGQYYQQIGLVFGQLTHKNICKNIIEAVEAGLTARLERQALWYVKAFTPASKKAWVSAITELYGENVAILSGNTDIDVDCAKVFGYTMIGTGYSMKQFYALLGLPKAEDIVPTADNLKYEIIAFQDLDEGSRGRFMKAFDVFAKRYPERAVFPVMFIYLTDPRLKGYKGFAGAGDKAFQEIWIAATSRTSLSESVKDIGHTLLHESRHCFFKVRDLDRRFVYEADLDALRGLFPEDVDVEASEKIQPIFVDTRLRLNKT